MYFVLYTGTQELIPTIRTLLHFSPPAL